jgi:predicted dithiol-disulfide oxidoreductase (DUF899 family)/uncharacterized protein YndB with AHSA1/START domain
VTDELRYERIVEAPPEVVFDAFTSAGGQIAFYGQDDPGWIVRSESEVRIGGAWTVAFGPSPERLFRHRHVFEVIDRPRRLLLSTTEMRLDGSTLRFETELTFEECADGTLLVMMQRGIPTDELRAEHARGVPNAFDRLEQFIRRQDQNQSQGGPMNVSTEREWQAARKELLAAERELGEHASRVEEQRRELPWVPVEKEYRFATEDGPRSLPELFEGRSQLLIYHLMFGEDWAVACPGCSSVADGLTGGVLMHLNDRDVTLLCMSHAPLEKLVAYKTHRGWSVPYVSGHDGDFLFDYGYAFRREEMDGIVRDEFDMGQLLRDAPQWLRNYREDVGAPDLKSAVSVSAGWSAFAMRDGTVHNTYRAYPPSRLVTPLFSWLFELLPNKS